MGVTGIAYCALPSTTGESPTYGSEFQSIVIMLEK